jgi:hypothetical protein
VIRLAFQAPVLSRVIYQAFARELTSGTPDQRPLGDVLWKVASGVADYREVLGSMVGPRVLRSLGVGLLLTLRNLLAELVLGVRWADHGRYPTVILKEKRADVRASLTRSLGLSFAEGPDFERMIALKVRAPAAAVWAELGRFGDTQRDWLRPRWTDVRRVSGEANAEGAVIRYLLPLPAMSFAVRLTRSIPGRALLYEVDERWARNGRIAFEIAPTRDGNSRLVVYTAFDFARGTTPPGRAAWRVFRALFPGFAHDVVWNHALCSIKRHAERDSRGETLAETVTGARDVGDVGADAADSAPAD